MDNYHVAAFAADGSLVGVGSWRRAALSAKWLDIAAELLQTAAKSGRASIPIENLDHLNLQLTLARSAGLASYSVHGILALSTLLLSGNDALAEAELTRLFVTSLRGSARVMQLTQQPDPFAALFTLSERPLHVVVPWTDPRIGDDDHELIQELSAHVAAAVLTQG